jgi:phosphotransacetylase
VAGDCDILVFPNLDGGNIFYKTCMFLANGKSAGLILGAKVPIVLTSRADTAEAKLNSIILAVVNANGLSNSSN